MTADEEMRRRRNELVRNLRFRRRMMKHFKMGYDTAAMAFLFDCQEALVYNAIHVEREKIRHKKTPRLEAEGSVV